MTSKKVGSKYDKCYTKESVANYCMKLFKEYISVNPDDLVIEPSAGDGAFIKDIINLHCKYWFYDIEPLSEDIIEQDYLKINLSNFKNNRKIHIIGMPPIDKQSYTAIKFIKNSASADTIAFILPKSFKKDSMKKYFDPYFHLIFETDLESGSFKEEIDVPCVFQIWSKSDTIRIDNIKEYPINFEFVKEPKDADIIFRKTGVNAGNIYTNTDKKYSNQTHYFIKFTNNNELTENLDALKHIHFGLKSISKGKLIAEFNKAL
jgi:hypothetical protein